MISVKIINESKHELPKYETEHAAGMDLRANLKCESLTLLPNSRALVPTGIRIKLPVGYEAQIRPRSGLAFKHGITVLNSPGTIDADYVGEIGVILHNSGIVPFLIEDGMRIAQMIVAKHETVNWYEVEELETTKRGEGGFGHTQH